MGHPSEVKSYEGKLGKETERAILFTLEDERYPEFSGKDYWFPLSQVTSIHRTHSIITGKKDSIVVSTWIARQKELPI